MRGEISVSCAKQNKEDYHEEANVGISSNRYGYEFDDLCLRNGRNRQRRGCVRLKKKKKNEFSRLFSAGQLV